MPGIPDDASRYADISVLSAAGKIPLGDGARLLITSLDSQPGPDAQRHARICPARRGGAWCRTSRQAIVGVTGWLRHGGCPACRRLLH
jgi:hypothetical protein